MSTSMGYAPESRVLETREEWFAWLRGEEDKTVGAYRAKPALLISDYHRERDIARDYEGREILELLQNANDQAAKTDQLGRVLIELSNAGLIVANTGQRFTTGGVGSLQTTHLSPKVHDAKPLIGNKGLGFRAVLNWSRTPLILSGALRLAYCLEHARGRLQSLAEQGEEIRQLIEKEQQGRNTLVLPLLSFPLFAEDGDLGGRIADAGSRQIWGRCEDLLRQGYDTVIGMPFTGETACAAARQQLTALRPEVLLFAPDLAELQLWTDGVASFSWRREGPDRAMTVQDGDKVLGRWCMHRRSGSIPSELQANREDSPSDYALVIAVPREESVAPSPLYCHFPTDVVLPLPVICHATLELEQNRKHVQQGNPCNAHVLGALAEFMAEVAEGVSEEEPEKPWKGCSLLMPKGDYPEDLKRECFQEKLIEAAKLRRVVPTLEGKCVMPTEARVVCGATAAWLPPRLFPEVVPIRDSVEERFLGGLGVKSLAPAEFKKRLTATSTLSLEERVALIEGMLGQRSLQEAFTSALFLDSRGAALADGIAVFLPPSGGTVPDLPAWADLRFLNEDMRALLAKRLNVNDQRSLQQKLVGFGLREYSLGNVVRALVAQYHRLQKEEVPDDVDRCADLLRAVFGLFAAEGTSAKRPEYPENCAIQLPHQAGGEAPASTLYLGDGFGVHGRIVQSLYKNWATEKLVAKERLPSDLVSDPRLRDFLLWIGVAEWPKKIELDANEVPKGYLTHVVRAIPYPARFENRVADDPEDVSRPCLRRVQSVDGLPQLLEQAEPTAILAWVFHDDRLSEWERNSPQHAILLAYPDGARSPRCFEGPVPSHVRWCLESSGWLAKAGEGRLRPKDCVLGERLVESLFPRPAVPSPEKLASFEMSSSDLPRAWQRAGVITGLAHLERDQIYAKLLELPERSSDGRTARALYQWLLDAGDLALGSDGINRRDFLQSGRMWGRHGDKEGYYPIRELHHVDNEGLPHELLRRLKIVDLPKRVGAEKVERLFGVKPVERDKVRLRLVGSTTAVGSTEVNDHFQAAKPYLRQLRPSQRVHARQLSQFKELRLEVCSELRAELAYGGETFAYSVGVWGWVIEDGTLYIRSDPAKPLKPSQSLLSNAISEALASIFQIADGGEFANILTCAEDERSELLRRLRGDDAVKGIDKIREEYDANVALPEVAPFPPVEPPVVVPGKPEVAVPSPSAAASAATAPGAVSSGPDMPLVIERQEHEAVPAATPRALQIRRVTAAMGAPTRHDRHVTDGALCEQKAMEFEMADDPPRWPVLVGQITGYQAPGCDVLSFATEAERDAFCRGTARDLRTVVRFIEVKGRSSPDASIELKGNELSAAERYGERYFLYRLYESDHGAFELHALRNPLQQKDALQAVVHVTLQRSASMERFILTGGGNKPPSA